MTPSRWRIGLGTSIVMLVLSTTACSEDAVVPPPTVTGEAIAELQVRAMVRAMGGAARRVCIHASASPQLRTEIAASFPLPVEYFDHRDELKSGTSSDYRCLVLVPRGVSRPAGGVIGVTVWAELGDLNALGQTWLFRWDGSAWVETTAEEVGITVTTSVS